MFITHQKQPYSTCCVQTCLAMLLDEPVEDVIAMLGTKEGLSTFETYQALNRFKFVWNALVLPELIFDGLYLLTVPSLNLQGRNHCILVERSDVITVYDPNEGKEGKLFYTSSNLSSWSEPIYVYKGGKLV